MATVHMYKVLATPYHRAKGKHWYELRMLGFSRPPIVTVDGKATFPLGDDRYLHYGTMVEITVLGAATGQVRVIIEQRTGGNCA